MAGIQTIEKLLDDVSKVVETALRVGDSAWKLTGDTLTITNGELARIVQQVLGGTDEVKLRVEAKDLSPFEIAKLIRRVPDLLALVLKHIK